MKKFITSALVATTLMSLNVLAGPMKAKEDLSDILDREITIDRTTETKAMSLDLIHTKLASIAATGDSNSSMNLAGLRRSNLETSEGPMNIVDVAQAIIASHEILNNSNKVGNDLDKGASDLKISIEDSNKIFADGIGIVAGKIHDTSSDNGKAVLKVLLMGKEIARGNLTVEQSNSYSTVMNGMTQLLRTRRDITAEDALLMTLDQLGMKKDQKIQELLGCKV